MKKRTLAKLRDFNSGKIQIVDNISLPVTSTRELTPEGYLKATAAITKVGVQMYSARDFGVDSDEMVGVFRPPETVFHPETSASIKLKPITVFHPEQDVDSTNISRLAIGTVGETVEPIDSERLGASIQITDDAMVKSILAREIEELSLGYDTFVISKSGTHNGQGYLYQIDGPMINNHLALVPEGRCGDSVKILDTGENAMFTKKQALKALRDAGVSEEDLKKFMKGKNDDADVDMKEYHKVLLAGKDIDMTQLVPAIVAELKPAIEEMVAGEEFKALLAKEIAAGMTGGGAAPAAGAEGTDADPDNPEGEVVTPEMLDAKIKDAAVIIVADASVRAKLITDAKALISDEAFDILGASNRDIIEKALESVGMKPEEMKGKDDAYLSGMLSVICKDRADASSFMKKDFSVGDGSALTAPITGIAARKLTA